MAPTTTPKKPLRPSRYLLLVRILFVVFGLVPVLAVAALSAQRSLPQFSIAQRGEWQRELSRRLGTSVQVNSIRYPAPHIARLESLTLLNPETNKPLLRATSADITHTEEGFFVTLTGTEILTSDLNWLQHLAQRAILDIPSSELASLTLDLGDLHFPLSAQQTQTLQSVRFTLASLPEGPSADLQFFLPGDGIDQPTTISLGRNRSLEKPTTHWRLVTSSRGLPAPLVAHFFPKASSLGTQALLFGEVSLILDTHTHFQLHNVQVNSLDLSRMVTQQFPQQLTGLANVQLEDATLTDGHLVQARGTLTCYDGRIGNSLLLAAQEQLSLLRPSTHKPSATGEVGFQYLKVGFVVDQDTLSLTGSSDPAGDNVLLARRTEILLRAPANHQIENAGARFARMLVPNIDQQNPAGKQARALLHWLPEGTATASNNGHIPTRLGTRSTTTNFTIREQ